MKTGFVDASGTCQCPGCRDRRNRIATWKARRSHKRMGKLADCWTKAETALNDMTMERDALCQRAEAAEKDAADVRLECGKLAEVGRRSLARAEAAEAYSAELNSRQVELLRERYAANVAWAKCEAEAAALTKERDEAIARANAAEERFAGLRQKRKEAEEALDKYGKHDPDCNRMQHCDNECTCGFDATHEAILIASDMHRTIDAERLPRAATQSEGVK